MSPGRLDAIRREIGLIMGWKAQSYTARRFADDLNQLHSGLVSIAAAANRGRFGRQPAAKLTEHSFTLVLPPFDAPSCDRSEVIPP